MKIIDSRFYRWMDTATNFFLLTILWLVVSIPIITFFPATTAMFGVFRAWEDNEGAGIIGPFFAAFRQRFVQSLLVGLVWAIIGGILLVDVFATRRMTTAVALPLFIATLSLTLFYTMLTIYIYPILANARTSALGVIKNAFLLSLSQPLLSLFTTFGLLLFAVALWIFPVMIIILGSPIAFGLNALFNRAVNRFPSATADEVRPETIATAEEEEDEDEASR
jgi:uncharacterized membrane protein YesL